MDDLSKSATLEGRSRVAPPKRRPNLARWAVLLVVLVGALVAGLDWWLGRGVVSTDDAFIEGHAVTVAPRIAGTVVALNVTDNQRVKAGDVLLQIDPSPYQAARDEAAAALKSAQAQLESARAHLVSVASEAPARLDAARAQLAAAQAGLNRAEADWRRQMQMSRQATTQQDIDAAVAARLTWQANVAAAHAELHRADTVAAQLAQARAEVQELEAKVALARAQLDTAELNLAWTKVTAPADGWITKRSVEAGNYVQAGQSLLALVEPDVWVVANFKESDLARLRPGQPAQISVDAYPDLRLKGHVDSVQLGTGGRFTAFPPENATGNFVKIVQRVPVKIVIDSGLDPARELPLGASVVPTVRVQ